MHHVDPWKDWLFGYLAIGCPWNVLRQKYSKIQNKHPSKSVKCRFKRHICISCTAYLYILYILYESCMSCRNRVERVRVLSSLDASRVRSRLPRTATQRTKKRDTSRRRPVPCLRHDECERSCIHVMWTLGRHHSCIKPKGMAGYGIIEVTAFVVTGSRRCVVVCRWVRGTNEGLQIHRGEAPECDLTWWGRITVESLSFSGESGRSTADSSYSTNGWILLAVGKHNCVDCVVRQKRIPGFVHPKRESQEQES